MNYYHVTLHNGDQILSIACEFYELRDGWFDFVGEASNGTDIERVGTVDAQIVQSIIKVSKRQHDSIGMVV